MARKQADEIKKRVPGWADVPGVLFMNIKDNTIKLNMSIFRLYWRLRKSNIPTTRFAIFFHLPLNYLPRLTSPSANCENLG